MQWGGREGWKTPGVHTRLLGLLSEVERTPDPRDLVLKGDRGESLWPGPARFLEAADSLLALAEPKELPATHHRADDAEPMAESDDETCTAGARQVFEVNAARVAPRSVSRVLTMC